MPQTLARPEYRLADNLAASDGVVFLTGTQALIRLALMQAARDAAAGLKSQGFISGYRGSPLGMVDQQAWKAAKLLDKAGVKFLPAINEELGATAVLGTQRVESDPERTADGVFAMWYGKGPGVDRAGDALKHGNAYGSSPHGGVLVVAGDDHGCVSSSMPHQSDVAMQSWHMPVVAPASVAEYLEFGLYGWALSRFSGNWVGLTALSEIVESGSTVDLDLTNARVAAWKSGAEVEAQTGFVRPADGLHYRWPDLPSLKIEERLHAKLDAVRAFAKVNPLDRQVVVSPQATVGIVTCGKAHFDLLEVFRRLDISLDALAAAGVRLYKVGLSYPARADPHRRLRRRPERDPRGRGEGRGRRDADARPVLQRRGAAGDRRQARRRGPAARVRARRAAAVAADRDRRRLARGALPGSSTGAIWWSTSPCRSCSRTSATRSSGCPTSAPAVRTTPRPRCPRARARRPASAATSWPRGWTATPRA